MKIFYYICLLSAVFLAGCAGHSTYSAPSGQLYRVTSHYGAIGDASGIQPIVRENNTLIRVRASELPLSSIVDDQGQPVSFVVQDGYYLLDHVVEKFNVTANGRTVRFELIQPILPADTTESDSSVANEDSATGRLSDAEAHALKMSAPIFTVMKNQLAQQRGLLEYQNQTSSRKKKELAAIRSKLDSIESQMTQEIAVVNVNFAYGNSNFRPAYEMEDVLIPAAIQARKINLYGRTDSKVGGGANLKIARARVLAVRDYLIKNGVDANKINISSLAAGDFVAPSSTSSGRALNRRVAIELIEPVNGAKANVA